MFRSKHAPTAVPAARLGGLHTARRLGRIVGISACITLAALAAQPGALAQTSAEPPKDELAQLLAERGLIEQINQQVSRLGHAMQSTASELVVTAMGFLGVPYRMGGNSAEAGFDCSGFVRAMFEQTVGLVLPRRADEQAQATQVIGRHELQPGDLVFFNTLRRAFSHVGIYVGDGKFIHSPRPGAVVRIEDMRVSYWQSRFDGARRVNTSGAVAPLPSRWAAGTSANPVALPPALSGTTLPALNIPSGAYRD
jgi:hypothetical protein